MSVTYASFHRPCLIERDWRFLARLRARQGAPGGDTYLAAILDRKLKIARLLPERGIGPDLVTMNSRVLFRVDQMASAARVVVGGEADGMVGATIPITTARGLALLGLSVGQQEIVERRDGKCETLLVEAVLYQPENPSVSQPARPKDPAFPIARDGPAGEVIRPACFARRV